MKGKKRFGLVTAGPAEFVIHQRMGRVRHVGRGLSFVCLPLVDQYYVVPSSANSITFAADQITAENQGVEVAGFAIWRVCDPEKIVLNFDFSNPEEAVTRINIYLRDVVESAIRHQVAKMTIEEVLRKRGSIILKLKEETAYIAGEWGLVIDTIEIKTVRIMSEQLFGNMQARFRDAVRLESETSALETEKAIAGKRHAQQEAIAAQEQEARVRQVQREAELEQRRVCEQEEVARQKRQVEKAARLEALANEREVAETEQGNKVRRLELEAALIEAEKPVARERFAAEGGRKDQEKRLAEVDDSIQRRRVETANSRDKVLEAIKALPAAAAALKIGEINVREGTLAELGALAEKWLRKEVKE